MWRALFTFGMLLWLIWNTPTPLPNFDPALPLQAQETIWLDYLEWTPPPTWGGACAPYAVLGVTWIEPRGVPQLVPVLWVQTETTQVGAILGLSPSDLRYVERRVWAQPVLDLRTVTLMRLCPGRHTSRTRTQSPSGEEATQP